MDIIGTAENPLPSGTVCGFIKTKDAVSLRYARWESKGKGKGTICLFTGRGEFIEKQFEIITDLRRRGFHVAIIDWRGQGRSDRLISNPKKGYIGSFSAYQKDIKAFLDQIVLPDCPPPYYALAHSMGGTILLHYAALSRPAWFRRMVITSPMIRLSPKSLPLPMIRLISTLACAAGLGRLYIPGGEATPAEMQDFATNSLSSDPERFARIGAVLKACPELSSGSPTFAWLRAAFKAMDAFSDKDFINRIETPTLLIAAGRDTIVSRRAIEKLGATLPAGGAVTIDGAKHDLQIEANFYRDQFLAAFDAFIPGSDEKDPDTAS